MYKKWSKWVVTKKPAHQESKKIPNFNDIQYFKITSRFHQSLSRIIWMRAEMSLPLDDKCEMSYCSVGIIILKLTVSRVLCLMLGCLNLINVTIFLFFTFQFVYCDSLVGD